MDRGDEALHRLFLPDIARCHCFRCGAGGHCCSFSQKANPDTVGNAVKACPDFHRVVGEAFNRS